MNFNNQKTEIVVVAMSGGVDSSLTAALLHQQGYQVIGITMHLWDYNGVGGNIYHESACCSVEATHDAQQVCHKLGIPHYVIDLREEFDQCVIENFVAEYLQGRTPNPCIQCNTKLKWGYLLDKARQLGAQRLATGHYARVSYDRSKDRYLLLKGLDHSKDQSYALWGLTQPMLEKTLFPLGTLTKAKVRQMASELALKTANRGESQEICFIPDNDYARFLKERLPTVLERIGEGDILDVTGQILGRHRGYPFYTIGQRKGLGIAVGRPLYVTQIEPQTNRIVVGDKDDLLSRGLIAEKVNWIAIEMLCSELEVEAKIRYKAPAARATITPLGPDTVRLLFENPQPAVTPGQSVVFYDKDVVVGGGIISEALK
ncbi:MAG: tRNA 2-thiouridine(34) synthase MnmA [candidate division KSB1 bacterium]|nr:tRNA 2-thiouridine(34) synthase MnmA [candidate division KSB1 bacterium]